MASFPAEVGVNPSCSTSEALPVKWIRRFTMTDTASGHWAQGILQWPVKVMGSTPGDQWGGARIASAMAIGT
eukprot:CAMPEP_0174356956 /NCGR_PEP_ID=MMETSP0811_2-20130205/33009_1 /TAXON_ID=73025 ORGANISM="Eutreptiella gymnastica-like, Strain CCMP1594" /NCGR_SAMPLE_ID=MMETSP0811_2 /ASSEMBLY_ACC=CAM_ASM_000667 /LENGTH=71 /DNA_ID=CAMNT_0015489319 /DNA_START=245 /DNA_END=458 /DNA_ORIENTATION=-